jgi:site-specific recombinase XerC
MARRGRGEGNIRKRKDGRWEGSKTVGLTLAGNPKRRSVYGKTRAEVARKLEELTTQFNYGTLLEPDKRTVKAFGQQWLEMKVSGGISSKTKMDYEYELGKTDLTIGALRLQDVKPVHIREVLKRLELDGASPRTRAKVLGGKMGPTKGRRNRVIPLPPSMAKLLLDQAEQWDFDKHPEHKKLFLIGADKPLNPSSPNHAMKKLCVKAGVKPCRVHDLRHTYGSLALRAGTPLELVSERMGHSNPTVTLNIYRHLLEDERRSHIYDIEEMLSPLAGFSKSAAVKLRSNARTAVN